MGRRKKPYGFNLKAKKCYYFQTINKPHSQQIIDHITLNYLKLVESLSMLITCGATNMEGGREREEGKPCNQPTEAIFSPGAIATLQWQGSLLLPLFTAQGAKDNQIMWAS